MKNLGYRLLKLWIKAGLYLYYGKIKISGLENVPRNEPVLFLPNHQGALMDVLLIVTDCHRKPFFLTRSDVFKRPM
ncbi:MAG TPA: 1-acyl-sn-glycerol-3-phosphate acyltransferase, partial [Pricia sp.]|nr:1-acyl-sn-glycerol-3-phosphate acyltransferase [Pricia sp.]